MNGDSETKRQGFRLAGIQGWDKVALTGLFIVSLVVAHFIVEQRTTLILSEPIELPYTGLSVSVPAGNGWKSQKQWQYQNNTYLLSSDFNPSSSEPVARVLCRYLLAAEEMPAETWFKQQADDIEGAIVETDLLRSDTLIVDWARIERPDLMLCTIFGTAELPDNRRLNIEVHQFGGQTDLAEKVFREIVNRLNFQDNQLVKTGGEIVTAIKSKGVESLINSTNQQSCFLIKDTTGQSVGFTIDTLNGSTAKSRFNIQASSYLHLKKQDILEHRAFLRCNDNIGEFVWQSDRYSRKLGRSSTEVVLNKAGIMSIRVLTLQFETQSFRPGPAAIPDCFLEQILVEILDRNIGQIVIDMIDADGKITPVLAGVIKPAANLTAQSEFAYAVNLTFLDERDSSEQVYFDGNKNIIKAVLQQSRKKYILESAGVEQILEQFPDYADVIPQINRPPRQNSSEILL